MKKCFFVLLGIVLLLGGCELFNMGKPAMSGSLKLRFQEEDDFSSRTLVPLISMDIETYRISASGPDGDEYGPNDFAPQAQIEIAGLAQGLWTVTVVGLNHEGTEIGRGSVGVLIIPANTSQATIIIRPLEGNGGMDISLTWPSGVLASPRAEMILTDSGGVDHILDPAQAATSAVYSGQWPAGYYDLSLLLFNGRNIVWGEYHAVRIISGQTTYGDANLEVGDLNVGTQGDLEITCTEEMQNPFDLVLEGQEAVISSGRSMTVSVNVDPVGEYVYSWYLNGRRITGEISSTINIGSALSPGSYNLSARVSDGSVVSSKGVIFNVIEQALGTISGLVNDASTGLPVVGAAVDVFSGDVELDNVLSDSQGNFSLDVVPGDAYTVTVSKEGYLPVTYSDVNVQSEQTTYLETILQVVQSSSPTGSIGGTISSALGTGGVAGATLNLRAGMNNTAGDILYQLVTDSFGEYYADSVDAGVYTASVEASGFLPGVFTIVAVGGESRTSQHYAITPIVLEGQTRIVLTWGSSPSDLDSHLTGPTGSGSDRFWVYFGERTYLDDVNLDTDDTTSYGPETITIVNQHPGEYRYYVHNYSNGGASEYSPSSALSYSGAQVKIYQGTSAEAVATFNIPTGFEGTIWEVFRLNGTTITPVNSLRYISDFSTLGAIRGNEMDPIDRQLMSRLPRK